MSVRNERETENDDIAGVVHEVLKDHIWWVPPDGGPAACWSANDHDDTPCGEQFTTGGEYRAHVAALVAERLSADSETARLRREIDSLANLAAEHLNCSGCPTPWWLNNWLLAVSEGKR